MKKILMAASVAMLWVSGAWAAGTAAGTDITNSATLSYSVSGVSQTDVDSNTDTFKVDKKIDMTLAWSDGDQVDVVPGAQDQNTTWSFVNTGNMDQNFTFGAADLATGTGVNGKNDTNDTAPFKIYYNNGGTWTEITGPIEVTADATIDIRVEVDIDATATNGEIMNIELNATAVDSSGNAETATSGADNKTSVDTVLAEAASTSATTHDGDAYNGIITAQGGYEVVTATLDLTKDSCVIEDPVNGVSANAKRIPGATIRYMFDINNTGSADATDISISDTLSEQFTDDGAGASQTLNSFGEVSKETQAGACSCGTKPSNTVAAGDIGESGRTVTVSGLDVTHGNHTCVSFEVDIY